MSQRNVIELTLAVFRVTESVPAHDSVRVLIRSNACTVLDLYARSTAVYADLSRVEADLFAYIGAIRALLAVARELSGGVRPINFDVLDRQYAALLQEARRDRGSAFKERPLADRERFPTTETATIRSGVSVAKTSAPKDVSFVGHAEINARQERILGVLRERQNLKISDFFGLFQDVSSKTIQRDLTDLVTRNMIQRSGEKRWTMYSVA